MTQGRAISALEALANIVLGWIVALATQLLVFPVMGLSVTVAQHLGVGAAFTIVSFVRSYCLRRLFERLARRGAPPGGRVNLRRPCRGTGGGRHFLSRPEFGPGVGKGQGR
ncbi:hypothetical protein [Roseovarius sp. TE539]|uniref:DUF7220 family protein n=1 Tax=Roseovarius sp. TE539 TaxID=2249812 RepID=UPI001C67359D|nr:hypothetical protein [Roseovarius sp. TE539]